MVAKYKFAARHGDWPEDASSRTAIIEIRDETRGKTTTLRLNAGEARALAREALRALGYTKVERPKGQWETTWEAAVEERIEPVCVVMNALLPRPAKKSRASTSN